MYISLSACRTQQPLFSCMLTKRFSHIKLIDILVCCPMESTRASNLESKYGERSSPYHCILENMLIWNEFSHLKWAWCSLPGIIFKRNQAHVLFSDSFSVRTRWSDSHKLSLLAHCLRTRPMGRHHWEQRCFVLFFFLQIDSALSLLCLKSLLYCAGQIWSYL